MKKWTSPNRFRLRILSAVVTAAVVTAGGVIVPLTASAAESPTDVMPADALAAFDDLKPGVAISIVDVSGQPDFAQALEVDVTKDPSSEGLDGEYEIAIAAQSDKPVAQGDYMVVSFWARAIEPLADGAGHTNFTFERAGVTYKKSANAAVRFGTDWEHFEFPFQMVEGYPAGGVQLSLWLGYGVQTFQVAGIHAFDYGQEKPEDYPEVSYDGRSADAAWRTEAEQRIDEYRKGDLAVEVVDAKGKAVPGAEVHVEMLDHDFNFGTAVAGNDLNRRDENGANYRSVFEDNYNQGTLGNDLKWAHWEDLSEREQLALPGLALMREQNKRVRGHTLVWGSWGNMPADVVALASDPEALSTRIVDHITDEASTLAGQIDVWDVVNEPYSEHNVTDILGLDEIAKWFEAAKAADPGALLALNDYGILSHNAWNTRHQDFVYTLVEDLQAAGAPIEALGLQGHFTALQPTAPEDVLSELDHFAELGLPIEITEFDFATADEQLQGDYTRDFLTAAFSSPAVTAVSGFGYWEGSIWDPRVALYTTDWTPKANAEAWEQLLFHDWWTDEIGTTDSSGHFSTRGFLGDYKITMTSGGVTEERTVSHTNNAGTTVTVVADGFGTAGRTTAQPDALLAGDFDFGPDGWSSIGSAVVAETPDAFAGSGALRTAADGGVSQNLHDVQTGTELLLSAWAKSDNATNQCFVGVRGGPAPGTVAFQNVLSFGSQSDWTQKVTSVVVPDGTTWAQAFVWQNAGSDGTCTFDEATLAPVIGEAPEVAASPFVMPQLPGEPNTLSNAGFESGSLAGWYCLGSCSSAGVVSDAHSGSWAMKAGGRAASWVGPVQTVTVAAGGRYDASMWAKLGSGSSDVPAYLKLKVYYLDVNGVAQEKTINMTPKTVNVNPWEWKEIRAENVLVDVAGTVTKAEYWLSTTTGTNDLIIDDASFSVHMLPPAGVDYIANGVAEGNVNLNWYCLGTCTISATKDVVHYGASALAVTRRAASWAGPAQSFTPRNGTTYKSTAWLRLGDGMADTVAQLRVKLIFTDGSQESHTLAAGTISSGKWTQLLNTGVALDWGTKVLKSGEIWISTAPYDATDATVPDLYVDDVAVQPAGESETALEPIVPTMTRSFKDKSSDTKGTRVYFGYTNPNSFGVPIPVGAENSVQPGGDAGQPVVLEPGTVENAFELLVERTEPTVSWTLSGRAAAF